MGNRSRRKNNNRFSSNMNSERNGFLNATMINPLSDEDRRFDKKIKQMLADFRDSNELLIRFPPMDREKRKRIHQLAMREMLTTKSIGEEPNRYTIVMKKGETINRSTSAQTNPIFLSSKSTEMLVKLIEDYPITTEDVRDYFYVDKSFRGRPKHYKSKICKPMVPPAPSPMKNEGLAEKRRELPSFKYKETFLNSLKRNSVVIISGGTGCGKTTQIPQFILENAHEKKEKVQIVCTQPRRLAAIAISERVSKERGENLGDTVGYHIRLEQKTSDSTVLTYCTSGVLLRTLSTDPLASGITHIILDEIHERETNTDYLLIALKYALRQRNDLKVILMSATIEKNMNLFETYFNDRCVDIIRIQSKLFDVQKFFLDDVLAMIGYDPPESLFGCFMPSNEDNFPQMDVWDPSQQQTSSPSSSMRHANTMPNLKSAWNDNASSSFYNNGYNNVQVEPSHSSNFYNQQPPRYHDSNYSAPPNNAYPGCVVNERGEWIGGCYHTAEGDIITESNMNDFISVMGGLNDVRPIVPNYHTTEFDNGCYSSPGPPNVHHPPPAPVPPPPPPQQQQQQNYFSNQFGFSGMTAESFRVKMQNEKDIEQRFRCDLKNALPNRLPFFVPDVARQLKYVNLQSLELEKKYLSCGGSQYEESVDWHLVSETIRYCADSPLQGSILVFLPGFEDIIQVKEKIEEWRYSMRNISKLFVVCLHSQMNTFDQNEVFKVMPRNVRKVILSTNIAEASLTIEDVVFVIDSGKVKEKFYRYDAKFSQLKVSQIAKSNAEQRAGRAGRVTNGFCFRLFSRRQFEEMEETQVAEMRRSAIHDVCLHAKTFAPKGTKVVDFLSMAPEPPQVQSIIESMDFLEKLGALHSVPENQSDGDFDGADPELTDLGRIMAQMPLDPQLSRLLIFGVALKCLKPILDLVAVLSYRDPYIVTTVLEREKMNRKRDLLAKRDFSDHLLFIRLIDEYCKFKQREAVNYCRTNYLNASSMRMIAGVRKQLLLELSRARIIEFEQNDAYSALSNAEYNRYAECWPMVQAAIAAGCYPFVGVSVGNSNKLKKIQTHTSGPSSLHPSTIIKRQTNMKAESSDEEPQLQFVVYQEMAMIDGGLSLRNVSVVTPACVLLFTGAIRMGLDTIEDHILSVTDDRAQNEDDEANGEDNYNYFQLEFYEIESWYAVRARAQDLKRLLQLRFKFMHYLTSCLQDTRRLINPKKGDKALLETIKQVLCDENQRAKFGLATMPSAGTLFEPEIKESLDLNEEVAQKSVEESSNGRTNGRGWKSSAPWNTRRNRRNDIWKYRENEKNDDASENEQIDCSRESTSWQQFGGDRNEQQPIQQQQQHQKTNGYYNNMQRRRNYRNFENNYQQQSNNQNYGGGYKKGFNNYYNGADKRHYYQNHFGNGNGNGAGFENEEESKGQGNKPTNNWNQRSRGYYSNGAKRGSRRFH